MEFRTKIAISNSKNPIDYNSKIVSLGSCFALNIAQKFDFYKFQNVANPFGIIFNPVSLEKIINRIVNEIHYKEEDLFFQNERWHSFEVHSDLSNPNKLELLNTLNFRLNSARKNLLEATHFIITYGTAWVYRNLNSNEIVSNCHKLPQNEFSKELLTLDAIEKSIGKTLELITKLNPEIKFTTTISPVRHLKDGFIENQQSKASLLLALHTACKKHTNCSYFPAYEIMMDELRDYRFYAEDMIHPSPIAINYIWQAFAESNFSLETQSILKKVEVIQKALAHKPFNDQSDSYRQFLENLNDKIVKLQNEFPQIHF